MSSLPEPHGQNWRYDLRLAGVPLLARLGHGLGMDWQTLGRKLGRETIIAQARELRNGASGASTGGKLDIVFLTMMGGNSFGLGVDVVLGLALLNRGHRVRFVLCDQALPVCEVKKSGEELDWERLCAKCYGFGRNTLMSFGFDVLPVSDLVRGCGQEDGLRWPDVIEASLLKHYRVGIAPQTEEAEQRRELFRKAASISASVGRALVSTRPDRVIMSHGIYSTWGPQRELLNEAGIPVLTYSQTKKLGAVKFNWGTSADWWDVSEEWERVKDTMLTPAQEALVDSYLASRRSHSRDTLKYNFGDEEGADALRARLGLDARKRTFVLFTNVLWDAASAQREIAFANPIEWVLQTIEWFAGHPEKQLVIKVHPAEVVIGTNQPFATLVASSFPRLPENVRLILPDEIINSWSVIHLADVGLVHTSTVGMELPLEGVPCVVVSKTHFRGKGFTVDIETREEYFRLLDTFDPAAIDRNRLALIAKRYAYLLFERYQIPFPYMDDIGHGDVRSLRFSSTSDLLADKNMTMIVDALERKGQFLLPE